MFLNPIFRRNLSPSSVDGSLIATDWFTSGPELAVGSVLEFELGVSRSESYNFESSRIGGEFIVSAWNICAK